MSSDLIKNNSMNEAGTLDEGPSPGMCPVGEQRRPSRHQKLAGTGWLKKMNVVVMECYLLSRSFDEQGKPIKGYRKKNAQYLKGKAGFESNRAKGVLSGQGDQDEWVANRT